MRALLPVLLAVLPALVGCIDECVGFDEVAIEGGTTDQRATVADALADFAGWTARGSICADRITLQDEIRVDGLNGTALGRYDAGSHDIAVVAHQRFLYDTVVHELCHAVDFQDDVSIAFPELFQLAPFYEVAGPREPDTLQREALALDCEVGPEALSMGREVARRCGGPTSQERMGVLLGLVYTAWEPLVPVAPVTRVPRGSVALPSGFVPIGNQPVATSSDEQLLVLGQVDGTAVAVAIDPVTGTIEPLRGGFVFDDEVPDAPARLFPFGAVDLGIGTMTAIHWPLASGELLRFLAVRDEAGWSLPPDPCVDGLSWVVEAEGLPWLVELDGETVRWSLLDAS